VGPGRLVPRRHFAHVSDEGSPQLGDRKVGEGKPVFKEGGPKLTIRMSAGGSGSWKLKTIEFIRPGSMKEDDQREV